MHIGLGKRHKGVVLYNPPEFWLNAQHAEDLWSVKRENKQEIEKIMPLQTA
jgi:plasmid maintenance system antidote protein VapI